MTLGVVGGLVCELGGVDDDDARCEFEGFWRVFGILVYGDD